MVEEPVGDQLMDVEYLCIGLIRLIKSIPVIQKINPDLLIYHSDIFQ